MTLQINENVNDGQVNEPNTNGSNLDRNKSEHQTTVQHPTKHDNNNHIIVIPPAVSKYCFKVIPRYGII